TSERIAITCFKRLAIIRLRPLFATQQGTQRFLGSFGVSPYAVTPRVDPVQCQEICRRFGKHFRLAAAFYQEQRVEDRGLSPRSSDAVTAHNSFELSISCYCI